MDLLQVLGLMVSLILVVVLVAKRLNYGVAMLVGTLILALFSQLTPSEFVVVFTGALTDMTTWNLVCITTLIPILAYCMHETGMVEGLVQTMRRLVSGRATLAVLPAIMGALPMPGGALMSAPMIEAESRRLGLTGDEGTFINVWFRHWNFFVYPLSSTLILLATLTEIPLFSLIGLQLFPVLLYLFIGYFVSIRKITERPLTANHAQPHPRILSVLFNISPILVAVVLNVVGIPMVIALICGILFIFATKKVTWIQLSSLLKGGVNWRPAIAIIGVMCFRYMITQTEVIETFIPAVGTGAFSATILLLLLAWIIGFATGLPPAAVAIIIPIAITLTGSISPLFATTLYLTIVLSYIISPMHLCLILTVEYYHSQLPTVYRKLIPAALTFYFIFLAVALSIPL